MITSEFRRQNCLEVAPQPRLFQLLNLSHRLQEKLVFFFFISSISLETWYHVLVYITLILCLLVVGA